MSTEQKKKSQKTLSRAEAAKETQATILDAAVRLFGLKGFKQVSIEQIAEAAGVAKGTIYIYYKSKKALFRAVCQNSVETFMALAKKTYDADWPSHGQRAQEIILSKFLYYQGLLSLSPFVKDLFEAQARIGQDLFDEANQRYLEMLASTLSTAEQAGELELEARGTTAMELANLLFVAAHGPNMELGTQVYERQLRGILAAMVRGFSTR